MADPAVVDACALVDLLLGSEHGRLVGGVLDGFDALHAPAHVDAEVLSALGRLQRAGSIRVGVVSSRLEALARAPLERHALPALLLGAWRRRGRLRLVDALYVELADTLGATLVTTDARLAAAAGVPAIAP